MDIKYLKALKDNPTGQGGLRNRPISLNEITQLEQEFNNSKPFPQALRELLYLAGSFCYILDFGLHDSQKELQEDVREWLIEDNRTINRPFFAIDIYNVFEEFVMVHLDEEENPEIYCIYLPVDNSMPWYRSLGSTLSQFCESRIARVKRGENPF